MVLIDLLS